MKLAAVLLCTFVVGALGTFNPVFNSVKGGRAGQAALGVGKVGAGAMTSADDARAANQRASSAQKWDNHDIKKSSVNKDWAKQGSQASHDAKSQRQAHGQQASGSNQAKDAANRASSKASAVSADRTAKDKWAANNNYEHNQAWAGNNGFRKNNKKHEGISYSFDKKFRRNDNDNGGYNAGHNLADRAIDDVGHKRSSYDRVGGSHAARTGNAQRQSADRSSGFGDAAWRNANAADAHGRDRSQASAGNANNRAWAEKVDRAQNLNRYNQQDIARAADGLNNKYNLDRNANRDTVGFGAQSQGLYGKGAGRFGPVSYGYGLPAVKTVSNIGVKGLNTANGVSDQSSLWDSANINKNQQWASLGNRDNNKYGNVANANEQGALKGFNQAQNGWKYDKGFSQDAAAKDQGARAANRQWADAGSSKAANQARHDDDEVVRQRANNQWNRSDRDKKVNEYKKFFSNDKKGGQNWERLKYNKDQTQDAAAADFANKQDAANRWQNAHRFDAMDQAGHNADTARASDAADKYWNQDAARHANGAQRKAAAARDGASDRVWGANNEARKYGVDQARDDASNKARSAHNAASWRQDHDERALRGARNEIGGTGYGFAANNYPYNGGYYGNDYYGNYGNAYPGYRYNAGYGYNNAGLGGFPKYY